MCPWETILYAWNVNISGRNVIFLAGAGRHKGDKLTRHVSGKPETPEEFRRLFVKRGVLPDIGERRLRAYAERHALLPWQVEELRGLELFYFNEMEKTARAIGEDPIEARREMMGIKNEAMRRLEADRFGADAFVSAEQTLRDAEELYRKRHAGL